LNVAAIHCKAGKVIQNHRDFILENVFLLAKHKAFVSTFTGNED
jgi:hypothetical protein